MDAYQQHASLTCIASTLVMQVNSHFTHSLS